MRSFRIVGGALLIWNLIGIAAFAMQYGADVDMLERSDPVTADAFRAMPWWAWAAYALAVLSGTAAAILLLARRRAATVLFALALAGVMIQFGWSFLDYGLTAKKGWSTVVFPLVIAAVALAAMIYARARERDGTLR